DGHHASPVHPWSVAPDQEALDRETHELIEKAIAHLPEIYRDVYVLADAEGLPNAEIADILGLSVAAVKSRLHRGRLLMRDALAPAFGGVRECPPVAPGGGCWPPSGPAICPGTPGPLSKTTGFFPRRACPTWKPTSSPSS